MELILFLRMYIHQLMGFFNVTATFAPTLLEKGVSLTRQLVSDWIQNGITEKELVQFKTTMIGQYKISLATSRGIAERLLMNAECGRQISYLDEFPGLIERLTVEKVNLIIKKYLSMNKLIEVSAGSIQSGGKTE